MLRHQFGEMLGVEVNLIPEGRHNRSGNIIAPTSVTVHNTSNTARGADARAHARYLNETGFYMYNGRKIWTSWHFTVDDGRVVGHLPLDEEGYHAHGNANRSSVGIEVCMNEGIDRQKADLRAARLVAAVLRDLNLRIADVKSHRDWTGKNCPELLLPHWAQFKQAVSEQLATIDPGSGEGSFASNMRPASAGEQPESVQNDEDVGHPELPTEYLSPTS